MDGRHIKSSVSSYGNRDIERRVSFSIQGHYSKAGCHNNVGPFLWSTCKNRDTTVRWCTSFRCKSTGMQIKRCIEYVTDVESISKAMVTLQLVEKITLKSDNKQNTKPLTSSFSSSLLQLRQHVNTRSALLMVKKKSSWFWATTHFIKFSHKADIIKYIVLLV